MTPPPSMATSPWDSVRTSHVPPPFAPVSSSLTDPISSELSYDVRPMDPSASPSFVDIVDALDSMMAPSPHRVPSGRTRWSQYKAYVASGDHIVTWLLESGFASSRSASAEFARRLVRNAGLIPTFKVEQANAQFDARPTSSYVHRGLTLIADHGLNCSVAFPGKPRNALNVLKDLNLAFAGVCNTSVSIDGHFVDYPSIRGSAGWRQILILLSELAISDDSIMSHVDLYVKKACLYNLYNILIFHAKLVFGHPTDLIKRGKFFNDAAYVISGKRITSVELEHDILRTRMNDKDDRIAWRLQEKDPRMHFVLNCGAQSCPPLVAIDETKTEEILQTATERFISNNCEIDLPAGKVTLSRLWKWFRKDFTAESDTDNALMLWIAERANKQIRHDIESLIRTDYKIKFMPYNWADNGNEKAKPDIRFMAIYDLSFSRTA